MEEFIFCMKLGIFFRGGRKKSFRILVYISRGIGKYSSCFRFELEVAYVFVSFNCFFFSFLFRLFLWLLAVISRVAFGFFGGI